MRSRSVERVLRLAGRIRGLTSVLIDAVAQWFPGLEVWESTGRHREFLTRLGITDLPGLMGAGTETAKAADLDPSPRYKRFGHLLEHGFDGHVEGGEWQLWVDLGKALDEVGSVHVGQCAPKAWGVGP